MLNISIIQTNPKKIEYNNLSFKLSECGPKSQGLRMVVKPNKEL